MVKCSRTYLLDMLRMPNHVPIQDPIPVQLVHHRLGRHAHRTDKDLRPFLDRDVDQLIEPALGVVVVRPACIPTHLRDQQINTKGQIGGFEQRFEFLAQRAELLGCVAYTTDDTEAASVGDGGSEGWTGDTPHAGEEDGVLDAQEGGGFCCYRHGACWGVRWRLLMRLLVGGLRLGEFCRAQGVLLWFERPLCLRALAGVIWAIRGRVLSVQQATKLSKVISQRVSRGGLG